MSEIFSSTPFILLLVLGSYLAGCKLYRKKHIALFHPLLVAMVLIIALLSLLDIDYDTFCAGSSFISFLLGPSVVALGYALYEQIEQIRGKEIPVLTAVFAGGIVGIVSVIAICRIMGSRRGYHLVTATQIGNHTHRYLLVGTLEWHTVAHRSYRIWLRAFGWYRRSCHSRPLPRQQPSSQRACLRFGGTWARNGTSHRIGSRRRGYQWLGHRADGSYHLFTYTSL